MTDRSIWKSFLAFARSTIHLSDLKAVFINSLPCRFHHPENEILIRLRQLCAHLGLPTGKIDFHVAEERFGVSVSSDDHGECHLKHCQPSRYLGSTIIRPHIVHCSVPIVQIRGVPWQSEEGRRT